MWSFLLVMRALAQNPLQKMRRSTRGRLGFGLQLLTVLVWMIAATVWRARGSGECDDDDVQSWMEQYVRGSLSLGLVCVFGQFLIAARYGSERDFAYYEYWFNKRGKKSGLYSNHGMVSHVKGQGLQHNRWFDAVESKDDGHTASVKEQEWAVKRRAELPTEPMTGELVVPTDNLSVEDLEPAPRRITWNHWFFALFLLVDMGLGFFGIFVAIKATIDDCDDDDNASMAYWVMATLVLGFSFCCGMALISLCMFYPLKKKTSV